MWFILVEDSQKKLYGSFENLPYLSQEQARIDAIKKFNDKKWELIKVFDQSKIELNSDDVENKESFCNHCGRSNLLEGSLDNIFYFVINTEDLQDSSYPNIKNCDYFYKDLSTALYFRSILDQDLRKFYSIYQARIYIDSIIPPEDSNSLNSLEESKDPNTYLRLKFNAMFILGILRGMLMTIHGYDYNEIFEEIDSQFQNYVLEDSSSDWNSRYPSYNDLLKTEDLVNETFPIEDSSVGEEN